MRTFIFVFTVLGVLCRALTVSASSLSVTTDSSTYNVGDTITVTVEGSAPGDCFSQTGDLDLIIVGDLSWDSSLVSSTGIFNSGDPLTGCEGFGIVWNASPQNATCGGALGDNCRVFDYLNGLSGSGYPIDNSPLVLATMAFLANAPGVASFDWSSLDFFDQQGIVSGVSVTINGNPSAASKCDALKKKFVGKKVFCEMKVFSKAAKKGEAADAEKLAKCDSKFLEKCQKAEEKGDCSVAGNCSALGADADIAADSLDTAVVTP